MPLRPRLPRPVLAGVAGLLPLAVASAAIAQPGLTEPMPREFGVDAGATFGFGDVDYTTIVLPAQNFRVGFFRSPTVSIEPYGSLRYAKVGSGDGSTNIILGSGLLYHFNPDRALNQAYVRPFAQVDFLSPGGGDSEAQFGVGAGLGLKVPWQERFAWRFEGAVGYAIETDNRAGGMTLGLLAGLSFFTR